MSSRKNFVCASANATFTPPGWLLDGRAAKLLAATGGQAWSVGGGQPSRWGSKSPFMPLICESGFGPLDVGGGVPGGSLDLDVSHQTNPAPRSEQLPAPGAATSAGQLAPVDAPPVGFES